MDARECAARLVIENPTSSQTEGNPIWALSQLLVESAPTRETLFKAMGLEDSYDGKFPEGPPDVLALVDKGINGRYLSAAEVRLISMALANHILSRFGVVSREVEEESDSEYLQFYDAIVDVISFFSPVRAELIRAGDLLDADVLVQALREVYEDTAGSRLRSAFPASIYSEADLKRLSSFFHPLERRVVSLMAFVNKACDEAGKPPKFVVPRSDEKLFFSFSDGNLHVWSSFSTLMDTIPLYALSWPSQYVAELRRGWETLKVSSPFDSLTPDEYNALSKLYEKAYSRPLPPG